MSGALAIDSNNNILVSAGGVPKTNYRYTVARVMGSPNVVTKDGDNAEVWIYDKISTVNANSGSSLFGIGGRLGGTTGGVGLGTYSSGASSRNQKTLTVVIKLLENKVTKVDYNASSF